jgi:hypothetical protein
MKTSHLLAALSALIPTVAFSSPMHNVWANRAFSVSEPGGGYYTSASADCALSWTEGTGYAVAIMRIKTTTGDFFEFQLASVISSTNYEINGLWNVTKNGVPVCTNCAAQAYGLTGPVGHGFKFNGSGYSTGATISNRYDF